MKKQFELLKLILLNVFVYGGVFCIAALLAIFALTRKIDSFSQSQTQIIFNIVKPEINIYNSVQGKVDKILVQEGQRVTKDTLLIQLSDPATTAKLAALGTVSKNNASALAEEKVIQSLQPFYEVRAPQDGVISQINTSVGSYLNQNSIMLVMYGNENVKLTGRVSLQDYIKFSGNNSFEMFSPRFGQNYQAILEGAGRVVPGTKYEEAKYELQFHFADPNEGAELIQGEGLQLVSKTDTSSSLTAAERIAKLFREFVAGGK